MECKGSKKWLKYSESYPIKKECFLKQMLNQKDKFSEVGEIFNYLFKIWLFKTTVQKHYFNYVLSFSLLVWGGGWGHSSFKDSPEKAFLIIGRQKRKAGREKIWHSKNI